ncbi:MAG: C25 family cysteine peptidase, partial [Chloroflexota bacterium]
MKTNKSFFSVRNYSVQSLLCFLLLSLSASTPALLPQITSAEGNNTAVMLPEGEQVFKILVDKNGIYDISAADLIAKGMSASLSPDNIQLMHYGEAVSWELISDPSGNPNLFDQNDKIRFYGWTFDESRSEKMYVNENVFWVIPGRSAASVADAASASAGTVVTAVEHTQRIEVDDAFSSMTMTETDWTSQNAEPDHFFWLPVRRTSTQDSNTVNLEFGLTHPSSVTSNATIQAHIAVPQDAQNVPGKAEMADPNSGVASANYSPGDVFTLERSIANNLLVNGQNPLSFRISRLNANDSAGRFFINFLDVTYQKDLSGDDDALEFSYSATGNHTFEVNNFTASAASDFVVYDISNRKAPEKLSASAAGGSAYRFNATLDGKADYFVASENGVIYVSSSNIEAYTPPALSPQNGGADWLAIGPQMFVDINGTTNDLTGLSQHRATYGHLTTHVVAFEDVVNQYGYGFASSHGLIRFLQHAHTNWDLRYAVLGGDGHYNPRKLACGSCTVGNADFNTDVDSLIPIHYSYTDIYQGLIPSDYYYSLLSGDDLVPEIAVGRLSVETTAQLQDAVSKIITYETNLSAADSWQDEVLITHDWPKDVADNEFRVNSEQMEAKFEQHGFNVNVAGLDSQPSDNDPAVSSLRSTLAQETADGVSVVSWWGHGSINNWGDSNVISVDQLLNNQLLSNIDKPFVSITHNCLDGNFAYPGWNGLGETLLRMGEASTGNALYRNTGSAAHFGSTGLGLLQHHKLVSDSLMEGFLEKGLVTIGDGVNYAKVKYLAYTEENLTVPTAELFSYNLLGDPAMVLFKANQSGISSSVSKTSVE